MPQYNIVQKGLRELADPQGNIIFNNDSDKPLFVLCPAPTIDYTSVVFFPPKGCSFAAVGNFSAAFSAHHDYEGRMIQNDEIYSGFIKWLRREGIKKGYAPMQLFDGYSHWGGRTEGIFRKTVSMNLDHAGKIRSAFVGNDHVDARLCYWQAQLEQFQELAFIVDDWSPGSSPNNTVCALKNLDCAIDEQAYYDEPLSFQKWNGEEGERLLRNLEQAIERLEKGERSLPTDKRAAFAFPSMYWGKWGVDHNIYNKAALLRSRMITLLGFPWHYDGAVSTIKEMLEKKAEAMEVFGHGIYDEILGNMRGFTDTMRRKYPVLEANPLEKATLRLIVQGISLDKVPALHAALLKQVEKPDNEEWALEHTLWEVEQLDSDDSVATSIFSPRMELGRMLPNCEATFFCYGKRTSDVLFSFDAGALGYGSRAALDAWLQPVQEACRALLTQYEPQRIFCGFGHHPKMCFVNQNIYQTETAADTWHEVFSIENPAV